MVAIFATACLPDPQRQQSVELLDRLSAARRTLAQQPLPTDTCDAVGDVENRLYGEPGLVETQPAWNDLTDAAHALQAVCGQATLLAEPAAGTAAVEAAHQRWQAGIQRELNVACDHLRAAAQALGRPTPC